MSNKQSKKAGPAHPPIATMVGYCVAAFNDYLTADTTLQNAKALWDAARYGLRVELSRAYKVIPHGKQWDTFKAAVVTGLVKARVVKSTAEGTQLIRNQLKALRITGHGTHGVNKGKKMPGRPEKAEATQTVLSEKQTARILLNAVAHTAEAQRIFADNAEIMTWLGAHAAILAGKQ